MRYELAKSGTGALGEAHSVIGGAVDVTTRVEVGTTVVLVQKEKTTVDEEVPRYVLQAELRMVPVNFDSAGGTDGVGDAWRRLR